MKILHVLNHFLPTHIAGTEVYVLALCKVLKKTGIESKILIPNYKQSVSESYFFEGIEVIKFAEPSVVDRALIMGKRITEGLPFFVEIIKQENPDIIHFHELAGSNGISIHHVKASKEAGFKTMFTFHVAKYTCMTSTMMYMDREPCDGITREIRCSKCWLNNKDVKGMKAGAITTGFTILDFLHVDSRRLNSSLGTVLAYPQIIKQLRRDLRTLEDNIDILVALTDWYKTALLRNGIQENHLQVVKQALPIENKNPIIHSVNKKLRIVFVGRINHFKGILELLRVIKKLDSAKIEFDIYGSSTEEDYMKECLKETERMTNVFWKGSIIPQQVVSTLSHYDLFCLNSTICEMSPLVIQEAFAAGIPVLAADVLGNAEQITNGENGWLFKFKSEQDLRQKLQNLIDNPLLIEDAKLKISHPRSFTKVGEEYVKLYENILKSV